MNAQDKVVGILALQGCIEPHERLLRKLGLTSLRVRLPGDLERIDRIILPGGESSTMLNLLDRAALFEPLQKYLATHAAWGICAGAILMAKEVLHPEQRSLQAIDLRATRNFYGSQRESFKDKITVQGFESPFEVDFIRAPLLEARSPKILTLAQRNDQPVMFRQGRLLASSFHVELGDDVRLHQYFLGL